MISVVGVGRHRAAVRGGARGASGEVLLYAGRQSCRMPPTPPVPCSRRRFQRMADLALRHRRDRREPSDAVVDRRAPPHCPGGPRLLGTVVRPLPATRAGAGGALAGAGQGAFTLAKVNVDENPELAEQFQVSGIPAVYAIKDGEGHRPLRRDARPRPTSHDFVAHLNPSPAEVELLDGRPTRGDGPRRPVRRPRCATSPPRTPPPWPRAWRWRRCWSSWPSRPRRGGQAPARRRIGRLRRGGRPPAPRMLKLRESPARRRRPDRGPRRTTRRPSAT